MTSRGLLTHPLVLEVAGKLLHQATSFQVRLTQIISIGPNSPSQPIHRDEGAFDFFDFPSDVHPPVQHDLGNDRLHRSERRHTSHPR
ncbi:MAG: hypothetical protein ACJAXA_001545 [Candidatus Aldehydirespiratoraceae bacterium]|jgi:hypothetical protein